MKVSAEVETFRPNTLISYATMCGWAVARAHAKSDVAAMIAGYLGSSEQSDDALVQYATAYETRGNVILQPSRRSFVPGVCRRNQQRPIARVRRIDE